ncbi:MAG: NAD(P)/FAD-dependent oxidoreductase [Ardenticatenaceae bacterium]|nr:NAD(P)/FAD-dependent oxidoreductase [Anaerolineales bacterium]MCB8920443.1 NAD(P)/FAD-dependent oxidoreductase [Ardenticatenaceae bacterium]MCB8989398.1 NAD(P)/FAD-dependent oxidoreductase [Ardenticatenaceae bacterium]MCB9004553.1 NAD(P)/FAD-dependent oxidoreductase [Ardenticatenaceae bacterium]
MTKRPRIMIVGAGFGGLFAARTLANQPVEVLLIDRRNYHTFTPLLYQVATCALDPSEIAYPVRDIFRKAANIHCLLGEVVQIDHAAQQVHLQTPGGLREEPYDYLIIATGSTPTYFGNDAFREFSLELRTLNDAIDLRNHILRQFEQAVWCEDETAVKAMTTIVVVGGGPTGLETAGAIYELYNHVLTHEYCQKELQARVVLVEMLPHLLAPYPEPLRHAAKEQLESLGVEVILGNPVAEVGEDAVILGDGTIIPTHTLVWSAGVRASPVAEMLDVPLQRGGRIPIESTTAVTHRPNVYAVGDIAYLEDENGQPYPMLIPVAQQQGVLAAHNILAELNGRAPQTFRYHDRGIMATIGRRRAVVWLYNRVPLRGYLAWLAWLSLHLLTLLGFRNRLSVFFKWVWNYFTYDRSVRIILR